MKSETHLIDCVEFMRGLPDKSFDLAIVDPPYGIGDRLVDGGGTNGMIKYQNQYNSKKWDEKIPDKMYFEQLFRVSINQIICGCNYFELPSTRGMICWDKKVYVPTMSRCEFIWTSFDVVARIVEISSTDKDRIHLTQKPVALYRWLLRNYAKPGDTIFDSHMGSQSSRIACHMEGYDFTGCELDPEYFEQGNQRYELFLKTYGTPDIDKAIPGQQINMF